MTHKTPPRIGMPTISNMAHKMLAKSTSYNKPANQENIKPINKQEQEKTLTDYRAAKQEILPKLKELKQILTDATVAYLEAIDNWSILSKEYEFLDRKERLILHEQEMIIKANKPKEIKSKSTEKISINLATKLFANLSPEKQAEILVLIKQQSKIR